MTFARARLDAHAQVHGSNVHAQQACELGLHGGVKFWDWLTGKKSPPQKSKVSKPVTSTLASQLALSNFRKPHSHHSHLRKPGSQSAQLPGQSQSTLTSRLSLSNFRRPSTQATQATPPRKRVRPTQPAPKTPVPGFTPAPALRPTPRHTPALIPAPTPTHRPTPDQVQRRIARNLIVHADYTVTQYNNGGPQEEPASSSQCMLISLRDAMAFLFGKRMVVDDIRNLMVIQGERVNMPGKKDDFVIGGTAQYDAALDNFCTAVNARVVVHRSEHDAVTGHTQTYPLHKTLNPSFPIVEINVLQTPDPAHFEFILYSPSIRMPAEAFKKDKYVFLAGNYSEFQPEITLLKTALQTINFQPLSLAEHLLKTKTAPTWFDARFFVYILPLGNMDLIKGMHARTNRGKKQLPRIDAGQLIDAMLALRKLWPRDQAPLNAQFEYVVSMVTTMSAFDLVRDVPAYKNVFQILDGKITFIDINEEQALGLAAVV